MVSARNIYTRNVGPTLAGLIAKAAEHAADKFQLDDEVDLARSLTLRAAEALSLTLEANPDGEEMTPERLEDARLRAEAVVRNAIDTTSRVAAVAAKNRALSEGAMDLSTVSWLVSELTRIVNEEIREKDPIIADKVVKKFAEIKLPQDRKIRQFLATTRDESFM